LLKTDGARKGTGGVLTAFLEKMKRNRKLELLVYAGVVLLAVALYFSGSCGKAPPKKEAAQSTEAPRQTEADDLEKRLTAVLSQIRGAGRVEVLVSYETSGEIVPATVSQTDESLSTGGGGSGTRSEQQREVTQPATVTSGGVQSPIVLVEKEPVVRGVIVVAEGAADPVVRMDLQRAVKVVTGVPISCIEVFEMSWQHSL